MSGSDYPAGSQFGSHSFPERLIGLHFDDVDPLSSGNRPLNDVPATSVLVTLPKAVELALLNAVLPHPPGPALRVVHLDGDSNC